MPSPRLVNDGTISCSEFLLRLIRAVENYKEYCAIMKVSGNSHPAVEWLDHFIEFLDLSEIERAAIDPGGPEARKAQK